MYKPLPGCRSKRPSFSHWVLPTVVLLHAASPQGLFLASLRAQEGGGKGGPKTWPCWEPLRKAPLCGTVGLPQPASAGGNLSCSPQALAELVAVGG